MARLPLAAPFAANQEYNRAPDAPNAPTGTPGSGQVTLAWSDNGSGDAAISNHYLYAYLSADGSLVSGYPLVTGSSATGGIATGLTNGVAYLFRVTALNRVGQSLRSSVSTSVTAGGDATPPTVVFALVGR